MVLDEYWLHVNSNSIGIAYVACVTDLQIFGISHRRLMVSLSNLFHNTIGVLLVYVCAATLNVICIAY